MSIDSVVKCGIRAVIRYLVAKEKSPLQNFNDVRTVDGGEHMNLTSLYKWCRQFKNGRPIWGVGDRRFRLTNFWKKKKKKWRSRRSQIDSGRTFPQLFGFLLHETITKNPRIHKPCARRVPKQLTEQHKLLDSFGWDVFNHPSHSLDLAPSDYHLITSSKMYMCVEKFATDE